MIPVIIVCAALIAAAAGVVVILVGVIISAMEVCHVGLWMCVGGLLTVVVLSALACCVCGSRADAWEDWHE